MVNGEASMAFTGERSNIWHRLGTQVSDEITPADMMKKAGVDWTVSKKPLFMQGEKGKYIPTKQCALIRDTDGAVLDYVSENWNPVQNEQAFDFFNDFVAGGDMKMDTAGSLKDGKIVWANAKMREGFDLFGGDIVEGYMLFTNPHKFGQGINIRTCMTRTVCWNTISMALREDSKVNFSQSHASVFNPDDVKQAMSISTMRMKQFKEQAAFLGAKLYTVDEMLEYFTAVFPKITNEARKSRSDVSRNAELAMSVVETQPGADYAKGSFWQLLNASTYTVDHLMGRSEDTRAVSSLYGTGSVKKQFALKKALEMAS